MTVPRFFSEHRASVGLLARERVILADDTMAMACADRLRALFLVRMHILTPRSLRNVYTTPPPCQFGLTRDDAGVQRYVHMLLTNSFGEDCTELAFGHFVVRGVHVIIVELAAAPGGGGLRAVGPRVLLACDETEVFSHITMSDELFYLNDLVFLGTSRFVATVRRRREPQVPFAPARAPVPRVVLSSERDEERPGAAFVALEAPVGVSWSNIAIGAADTDDAVTLHVPGFAPVRRHLGELGLTRSDGTPGRAGRLLLALIREGGRITADDLGLGFEAMRSAKRDLERALRAAVAADGAPFVEFSEADGLRASFAVTRNA